MTDLHPFDDDGRGDCRLCPLPPGNPVHAVPAAPARMADAPPVSPGRKGSARWALLEAHKRMHDDDWADYLTHGVTDLEATLHAGGHPLTEAYARAAQLLRDDGLLEPLGGVFRPDVHGVARPAYRLTSAGLTVISAATGSK